LYLIARDITTSSKRIQGSASRGNTPNDNLLPRSSESRGYCAVTSRKHLQISPERVRKKIAECNFFLAQMHERQHDESEFSFCLSAFLAALSSVAWLAPMAAPDLKRRKQLRREIEHLAKTHADLRYLLSARHAEVHRDGVAITISFGTTLPAKHAGFRFPNSRFRGRLEGRFAHSRFQRPWAQAVYRPMHLHTWRFVEYPLRNIVEICRDCLNALNLVLIQAFPR
jgi:hypothetical protein